MNVGKTESICSVCGRTLLTGEGTEAYVNTGGEHREVCDLCRDRVEHQGWVRAEGHDRPFIPKTRRKRREGGSIKDWLRGQERADDDEQEVEKSSPEKPEVIDSLQADPSSTEREEIAEERVAQGSKAKSSRKKERRSRKSVHAIPTSDAGKLERSVELFNQTEHKQTVAGVARTLGKPTVAVVVRTGTGTEVNIVVGWELSWYRYIVDVSKKDEAVDLLDRGDELDEIPENQRAWNAEIDESGKVDLIE